MSLRYVMSRLGPPLKVFISNPLTPRGAMPANYRTMNYPPPTAHMG